MLIGLPTILLLPSTTHSLPSISIPDLLMSWITPAGVHDTKPGCPMLSAPTLIGWKPSTSFFGDMVFITLSSSICFGSGSCTSIPFTLSSELSFSISARSSSSVVSSGSSYDSEPIPIYSHAFFLFPTYTDDAGSFPTWMTARHISTPSALSPATFSLSSSFICFDITLPSISLYIYLSS